MLQIKLDNAVAVLPDIITYWSPKDIGHFQSIFEAWLLSEGVLINRTYSKAKDKIMLGSKPDLNKTKKKKKDKIMPVKHLNKNKYY
jgi:hypothetical protein